MKYTTLAIVNYCQHGKQAVITQEGAAVLLMLIITIVTMLIVTSMYIKSQTPANITGEVVRRPHNQNGSSVGYTIISMYALKVAI